MDFVTSRSGAAHALPGAVSTLPRIIIRAFSYGVPRATVVDCQDAAVQTSSAELLQWNCR